MITCAIQKSIDRIFYFRCSCNFIHWSKCYFMYQLRVQRWPVQLRAGEELENILRKAAEVVGYSQNKVTVEKNDKVVLDQSQKLERILCIWFHVWVLTTVIWSPSISHWTIATVKKPTSMWGMCDLDYRLIHRVWTCLNLDRYIVVTFPVCIVACRHIICCK